MPISFFLNGGRLTTRQFHPRGRVRHSHPYPGFPARRALAVGSAGRQRKAMNDTWNGKSESGDLARARTPRASRIIGARPNCMR
jgi:hypothetical protein